MKTRRNENRWGIGLILAFICICSIPCLAGAGTAPPIPTGPLDAFNGTPDYYTTANWANSPQLSKFVDTLPGLGADKANNLGQYLPVAVADTTSYPGSDYYIIELREYFEQMHSQLNPTKLRGYVQVDATGNDISPIHYLGPVIVAERDRPVRIKFTNKLPAGAGGDLFIPVDTSVMGAGTGPANAAGGPCDNTIEPNLCASYTQNRADIHLHGGRTPWISDGTPHQWITPAGEPTPFKKGVSLQNVPDMPDPGDGSSTYYYTNEQSARLMFYHDHAFGITRLNVYAGEAAGYVITDKYEKDLVDRGLIPADQIPLIIQDKTFVDATPTVKMIYNSTTGLFDTPITVPKVRETDPLWNWGSQAAVGGVVPPVTGDLWLPHVYMPAQNQLAGSGGINAFGRWMYGPWFYPATVVKHGPVANPYYDADCSSPFPSVYANCTTPGQPTQIPGTPNVSMGMEAFQDTAVVNGTVFPSLTVDPRAYRFRILNAANDRFQNLSFYKADLAQVSTEAGVQSPYTEVKMADAAPNLAVAGNWPPTWPVDGRPELVPDPGTCTNNGTEWNCSNWGPKFLQIGTEGGFLPQPVVRDPQPITYITDPTAFWVGIVDKTALALGPAERADVVVDFSQYAGQTLILYNDAPAAWPARVASYDYYTNAPDMRDSGGFGTGGTWDPIIGAWVGGTGPVVGKGPNTRTLMQVIVRQVSVDAPYTFDPAALAKEFTFEAPVTAVNPNTNPNTAGPVVTKTLFERSQDPIIVGQSAYSSTYPNSYFPPNFPWEGINQINDHYLNFVTLAGQPIQVPTEPKGIHDEMGASFDPEYGRMSGNLGMQLPNPTTLTALLVLYGYSDLPTETVNNSTTVNVQVIGTDPTLLPWTLNSATDGTQIWKISHNGVDTHPIHFHIFDVQLINRVGWDGMIALPEPNELGWKDTIKISPLMDTIVAVRPRAPLLPFGITKSLRPLNPSIPIGSGMGFNSVDWKTGQARVPAVTNALYDFGWEYVWHCHILSHEEMDMMRPVIVNVQTALPGAPVLAASTLTPGQADLAWTDPTPVNYVDPNPATNGFGNPQAEIGFRVEVATNGGAFAQVGSTLANVISYPAIPVAANSMYQYRVVAYNASGSTTSNTVTVINALPPVIATTTLQDGRVAVAYNQALAVTDGIAPFSWSVTAGTLPPALALKASTGVISGTPTTAGTYTFTVTVTDIGGRSASQAYTLNVLPPLVVIATPLNLTATIASTTRISLAWKDASKNENNFAVWRSANGAAAVQVGTVARSNAQSTQTGGNVTFNDNTVTVGNIYVYYVIAVRTVAVAGTSTPSNTASVMFTVPAAPSAVATMGAVVNNNNARAILNWIDNASNESGFTVQMARNATFTNNLTTTNLGANATTFQAGNLSRGSRYWFRVRANNQLGSSAWVNATPFPLMTP
jgi:FtsP/CotA-like multicopper oxidase with cupredoxin domain